MKIFTLHQRPIYINYKQSLCSFAAFFVFVTTLFTAIVPFYITYLIHHKSWHQQIVAYEQPNIQFKYNYIFLAEYINTEYSNENQIESDNPEVITKSLVCSSYKSLTEILEDNAECSTIKVVHVFIKSSSEYIRITLNKFLQYWEKDFDSNGRPDQIQVQLIFAIPAGYSLKKFNIFLELDTLLNVGI